ncbi:MAG: radical SAM protein [Bacilli bacterium]|nr:radical SAM protein [Bacilli bacterium]
MEKIATTNLGLIITEKCNLNCRHCLMGGATNRVMSDEVIEATLGQFKYIMNLCICGGEPTLALDRMKKIFDYVIQNKILVDNVSVTINGTIYSKEFLVLLDQIEDFINPKHKKPVRTNFRISYDVFHGEELNRSGLIDKYVENVERYSKSPYFGRLAKLGSKVFREGNAENLDSRITVPFHPYKMLITYVGSKHELDTENGLCYIGPFITISPDGIVTECDASIEHQLNEYNYGSVLENSIEDIFLNKNVSVVKPKRMYRSVNKEVKRYLNQLR